MKAALAGLEMIRPRVNPEGSLRQQPPGASREGRFRAAARGRVTYLSTAVLLPQPSPSSRPVAVIKSFVLHILVDAGHGNLAVLAIVCVCSPCNSLVGLRLGGIVCTLRLVSRGEAANDVLHPFDKITCECNELGIALAREMA